MSLQTVFLIEGKPAGVGSLPMQYRAGSLYEPAPTLYICPFCGDIWARMLLQGQKADPPKLWQSLTIPCRKHLQDNHRFSSSIPPGTMNNPFIKDFWEQAPAELLRWELERLMDWYEYNHMKGNSND